MNAHSGVDSSTSATWHPALLRGVATRHLSGVEPGRCTTSEAGQATPAGPSHPKQGPPSDERTPPKGRRSPRTQELSLQSEITSRRQYAGKPGAHLPGMRTAVLTALITALLVLGFAAAAPAALASITISATFWYEDTDANGNGNDMSPMRDVTVKLMEDEVGPNEVIATKRTDYYGRVSFTVNNDDGPLQSGRDPYLKVYSENGAAYCQRPDVVPTTYTMSLPKAGTNVPNGFSYSYGTRYPESHSPAWQSIDAALDARDWVYANTSPRWRRADRVGIIWPYVWGRDPDCFYMSAIDRIWLPKKSDTGWDKPVVYHEYGHAIMWTLYGGHWPPGDGPDPHDWESESSRGFAMVEGWAEFMGEVVGTNPATVVGPTGIETVVWQNRVDTGDMDGDIVEGSIAAVLWDIVDGLRRADRDTLCVPFSDLFTVMRDYQPQGIHQFWDGWGARFPDLATRVGPLSSIYYHYGIDKDRYVPYGVTLSIGSPGSLIPSWTSTRDVTLTVGGDDYGSGVSRMRFSENGVVGDWQKWTAQDPDWTVLSPWTLSSGDGPKTVAVQLQDLKGQQSPWVSATVNLDTLAPEVSGLASPTHADPSRWYADKSPVFTWNAASDASGVAGYSCSIDREPTSVPAATVNSTVTTTRGVDLYDGIWCVHVRACDRLGNWGPTATLGARIDSIRPVTTASGADDAWHNSPVTLTFAAEDSLSGVAGTEYALDGGAWTSGASVTVGTDGEHTVSYRSLDAAGNLETAKQVTVRIDTRAPAGSFVLAGGAATTASTAVAADSSVSDAHGPLELRFSTDGRASWSGWFAYAAARPITLPAGPGVKTVYAQYRDVAGNVLELSDAIELVEVPVDGVAPSASASGVTAAGHYRSAVAVTLTAVDNAGGSGVASITYTFHGRTTTVLGASVRISVPAVPNGLHVLSYHATDRAANVGTEAVLRFTTDTLGPVTAGKAASGLKGRAIGLRYRATDALSPRVLGTRVVVRNGRGVTVRSFTLGARNVGMWYSVRWTPTARGTYRYYVYGKDLAGNAQSARGSARISVK